MDRTQMLPPQIRNDVGAMAMMEYSVFLLRHDCNLTIRFFNVIPKTHWLCLTPLEICSQYILDLQAFFS